MSTTIYKIPAAITEASSVGVASGEIVRRMWATSVIMTGALGRLNNVVGYRLAVSEAEAKGLAIAAAEKLNPTLQLFGVAVCEIEQRHIDRMATSCPSIRRARKSRVSKHRPQSTEQIR
jgi:hypothetical protein